MPAERQQFKRTATIKEQIERLNKDLSAIFGAPASSRAAPGTNRTMSVSARKKIAAAQRARWANLRRGKPPPPKPAAKAKKKTMSPAAGKKLSAKLKGLLGPKESQEVTLATSIL